jgi:anti-sigma regulatory factor (Ser/Thr protein kinase)
MLTLQYPIKQSISFSRTLFRLYRAALDTEENKICFDLKKSKSLTPFGVIMLTSTIVDCFRNGKQCHYVKPDNKKLKEFLRDIGFNNFFNLKGRAEEKNLIQTKTVQLRRCSGLDYEIIDRLTDLFNHHLNLSPGVKGSLRMSLQETMTNVIDHSGVSDYFVCANSYRDQKLIRLCIADLGKGILNSLKSIEKYQMLKDDYDAIRQATNEGVSSRPKRAGLGLTHIKNFIKINEGQLCIISGKGKVFWKYDHGKILNQKMEMPFPGTIVKLIINIDKEGYYFLKSEAEYIF